MEDLEMVEEGYPSHQDKQVEAGTGRLRRCLQGHYPAICLSLLVIEGILAVAVLGALAAGFSYLSQSCWLGLGDPGPIEVTQRYFVRKTDGTIVPVVPDQYSGSTDQYSKIGVVLELKQECYCQDMYAEVVPFRVISHFWLESKLGGGAVLEPVERDGMSAFEGTWHPLPPTDRYKVELHLKCAEDPDLLLKKIDFATFEP